MNKHVNLPITDIDISSPFELTHYLALASIGPTLPEAGSRQMNWACARRKALSLNVDGSAPNIPCPTDNNVWERYLYKEPCTEHIFLFFTMLQGNQNVTSCEPRDNLYYSYGGWKFEGGVLIDQRGSTGLWPCKGEFVLRRAGVRQTRYGQITLLDWKA